MSYRVGGSRIAEELLRGYQLRVVRKERCAHNASDHIGFRSISVGCWLAILTCSRNISTSGLHGSGGRDAPEGRLIRPPSEVRRFLSTIAAD